MATELIPFAIEKFLGRITGYVDVMVDGGYAKLARDIDWRDSRGAIQGAKTHTQVHDLNDKVLSIDMYGDNIISITSTKFISNATEVKIGGAAGSSFAGAAIAFANIDNNLICANGVKMVKWDGTYLDQVGTAVPAVGSFAAAGTGSGSFTVGDWDYKVTFVNRDDVEGNPSAAITATAQGASKASCNLTAIPTGSIEEGIKSRRIYRTITGGASWYLLTTIADNTTTTYTDTTVDGSLGTSSPPSSHNKPTAGITIVERVGDRLFGAGDASFPCRLYYSLPIPFWECWPLTYYNDFPNTIKVIKKLGDNLLVITTAGPIIFSNLSDPSTMTYRDMLSVVPADSARAAAWYNNEVFWHGPTGVFKTSGVLVTEDTENVTELIPGDVNGADLEFDSYGTMFLVLNSTGFTAEIGTVVDMASDVDTFTYSAELGRIVKMTSSVDVWEFTSELGKIIAVGEGAEPADVIIKTKRGSDELWWVDSQPIFCLIHNQLNRVTYVGTSDGASSAFTGARRSWVWQSVYSHFADPIRRKRLEKIRFRMNGITAVTVYGDTDVVLHTETITQTEMGVYEMWMPPASWAYKFSVKFEGTATGIVEPPVVYFYEPERL